MSFLMLTKKIQAQKRHNYIYEIYFKKSNVFENGCLYMYVYICICICLCIYNIQFLDKRIPNSLMLAGLAFALFWS